MLILLGTTLTTSFLDSLNPSAIAQQLLLMTLLPEKRRSWYFILGLGSANLVMGLAIYYGIAAWLTRLLAALTREYPQFAHCAALAAGVACLATGLSLLARIRLPKPSAPDSGQPAPPAVPFHFSPLSLFWMGAAFCLVELTSAFPYFGFLALLAQYHPAFPVVLLLCILYNLVYLLPLILLYFGYARLRNTPVIQRLERVLERVSALVVPVAVTLVGLLLIQYGAAHLL